MKLVVMGTGPFAVPMFESLLASKHQLLALVTRPVRPSRQRGRSLAEPMRQAGLAAGIDLAWKFFKKMCEKGWYSRLSTKFYVTAAVMLAPTLVVAAAIRGLN